MRILTQRANRSTVWLVNELTWSGSAPSTMTQVKDGSGSIVLQTIILASAVISSSDRDSPPTGTVYFTTSPGHPPYYLQLARHDRHFTPLSLPKLYLYLQFADINACSWPYNSLSLVTAYIVMPRVGPWPVSWNGVRNLASRPTFSSLPRSSSSPGRPGGAE